MRPVTLLALLVLAPLLAGSSCSNNTKPNVPEVVRVPVEKTIPLPSWATDPLPLPVPADGTVGERVRSENDRGEVIVLGNCHRRLLRRMERGEAVDPKECES